MIAVGTGAFEYRWKCGGLEYAQACIKALCRIKKCFQAAGKFENKDQDSFFSDPMAVSIL